MNKRGISAIVATVLIILITVAAVTILWAVIIPMIQDNLDFSSLEGRVSVVTSEGYTYYDADSELASVQVKRDVDDGVMNRIKISFSVDGDDFSSSVVAPESGSTRVYIFNLSDYGEPESVSVAPIFAVENREKEGPETSAVVIGKEKVAADAVSGGSLGTVYNLDRDYTIRSCLDLLEAGNVANGIYEIDPDGDGGGEEPFEVYCDMTTDGGGWTRIDYSADLVHENQFNNAPDSWRWIDNNFTMVLTNEQIQAIQSVSAEGRQRYNGSCKSVLHYYFASFSNWNYAFGFMFLNGEKTNNGTQDLGIDFTIVEDGCATNGALNNTVLDINDVRVPLINVQSRDNGNGEQFGSELTQNPAWLR
jgi:flagellin-like protein